MGGVGRWPSPTVVAHPFTDLSVLDAYAAHPFPPGTDPRRRRFYAPDDRVHDCLVYLVRKATRSLFIGMYGFDDEALAAVVKEKLEDPSVFVQLTLDSSQAGGVHEAALLATESYPASSVAVGRSEAGAIMHLKTAVIDSSIVVGGSTNWSASGEGQQDNELYVVVDAVEAGLAVAKLSRVHAHMLGNPVHVQPKE